MEHHKIRSRSAKAASPRKAVRSRPRPRVQPKVARTKSVTKLSTADQLLEATSKILAERNSIEISLSEIAESSGLNSALIKYHFGSKDGLLVGLVRYCAGTALSGLENLANMKISPEQKIRLHIAGVINTYTKYPYLNRLIHLLLTKEDTITQEIADFFVKPIVVWQTQILREGAASGAFRTVDPMFFYYAVIGACDHLFFGRFSRKYAFGAEEITTKMRESYIEFVCDMAMRMLRREPT